ncbi:MAG: hypothetical protein ABIE42_01685 [Candidatus Eisenbacteria bacterium]
MDIVDEIAQLVDDLATGDESGWRSQLTCPWSRIALAAHAEPCPHRCSQMGAPISTGVGGSWVGSRQRRLLDSTVRMSCSICCLHSGEITERALPVMSRLWSALDATTWRLSWRVIV